MLLLAGAGSTDCEVCMKDDYTTQQAARPRLAGSDAALASVFLLIFFLLAPSSRSCVTNVVPFAITTNQLNGVTFGNVIEINDTGVGSGGYGKINLRNYPNVAAWLADMVNLGCTCLVCEEAYSVIAGNAQVAQAFNAMAGGTFAMPVINEFDAGGTKPLVIVGFIRVREVSSSGTGGNWVAFLELLSIPPPVDLTADSDGDGQGDYAEFLAGTNPTNSASFFGVTGIAAEGHNLRISWMTGPGKTNVLLRGESVSSLTAIGTITTASSVTNFLDAGAATNAPIQFYRLKVAP